MQRDPRAITDPAVARRIARRYFLLACLVWAPMVYWMARGTQSIRRALPIFGPADWLSTYVADPSGQGLNGAGAFLVLTVFIATTVVCGRVGQVGRRYGQRADELQAQLLFESIVAGGARPPYVLYLRPFKSTGAYYLRLRAGKYSSDVDFEGLLRDAARPIGPLVALGGSLEWVGGAARIESTEAAWRTDAETLMRHARLIVILPGSHPGTLWEIERLIDRNWIPKTVFIDAANNSRTAFAQDTEWDGIVRLLAHHGYRLPADDPEGQIIAFGTSKEPQLVEALRTSDWHAAFQRALSLSVGTPVRPVHHPTKAEETLGEVVFIHLAFSATHAVTHAWGWVPLGPAAVVLFVLTQAGPLAGLAYMRRQPRAGALIVAASMAAALVVGLIGHFLMDGTDNVERVAGEPQVMFGLTAVLMIVVEAVGVVLGIKHGRRMSPRNSP